MSTNIRYFRPGQCLFKEGEPSRCMYLIKKGTVAVRKMKGGGTHIELARVYSNEVLGELSFFDRLPRSASAIAMTEVEVMEISFDSLDSIYARVPVYLKTIIASVAERLRRANDTIRRLQKNVVNDEIPIEEQLSAEDVLKAAEGIKGAADVAAPEDGSEDPPKE